MGGTDSIKDIFKSFQYVETILKYVKYSDKQTSNNMNVRMHISFDAGEIEEKEGTKQILKIACNTSFVSDNDEKNILEVIMQSVFTVEKDIDLKNIKDIVENNEELRSYLLNPVLSESSLLIGFITQKTFKVPTIIFPNT